jgi:hypothetical protein
MFLQDLYFLVDHISPFNFITFFLHVFGTLWLGAYMAIIVTCAFLICCTSYHYNVLFVSSNKFCLKVYFIFHSDGNSTSTLVTVYMVYLYYPFTFNLFQSLKLKSVSFSQNVFCPFYQSLSLWVFNLHSSCNNW